MKIVWGAMRQNDRRFCARILSGVNAVSASLYKLFLELHVSVRPRITDSAPAPRPYDGPFYESVAPLASARLSNGTRQSPRFLDERLLAQFFSRLQKLVTESRAGHRPR